MVEDIGEQLNIQEQTLIELEDELEMEISRVIALKNSIDPELIEDLEKIEEGLYVEVKMIHETKKNMEKIIKLFKNEGGSKDGVEIIDKNKLEAIRLEVNRYKKRSEKLAKQLIEANEEIEQLNNKMEDEIKKTESKLKNDFINKLKDKDQNLNDKLLEAKRREEELQKELEALKNQDAAGSEEVARIKEFFDKKIKNLRKTMTDEFIQREKGIAEKAIIVYNKKKEKIYETAIKEVLKMKNRPPEVVRLLLALRKILNLAEDVYSPENFSICNNCGEVVHISQENCPNCNVKTNF